jgi:hypothetical protein
MGCLIATRILNASPSPAVETEKEGSGHSWSIDDAYIDPIGAYGTPLPPDQHPVNRGEISACQEPEDFR